MKIPIINQLITILLLVLGTSHVALADDGADVNAPVENSDGQSFVVSNTSTVAQVTTITPDTPFIPLDFGVPSDNPSEAAARSDRSTPTVTGNAVPYPVPNARPPTSTPVVGMPPAKDASAKIASATTAAELFATKKAAGAIAIGAAEGNLTLTGKATSLYSGHTDPGNHVTNRGFCSWNRAAKLTVAQADQRCLAALQRQSAATERKLVALGIDPKVHPEALINGTDLWNQSNSAGPLFAVNYKKALDQELSGKEALVGARVEAFRDRALELDASGLFGICAREPYYRSRLTAYAPNSESWRWECIALDQRRRVEVVSKALKQNMGRGGEKEIEDKREQLFEPVALSFDIDVSNADVKTRPTAAPSAPSLSLTPSPPLSSMALDFGLSIETEDEGGVEEPAEKQPGVSPSFKGNSTQLGLEDWTPNLKKTPKVGDKIAGYTVTSPYGKRYHPLTNKAHFHRGVDLDTPINTNLYAIGEPGTKTSLKCWTDAKGGGLVATMTSPTFPSLKFDALHMYWCKGVTNGPGIKVAAGQLVGGTGNTGHSTGPHLHFQVRDLETGKRISPPKGLISWALTGKEPQR